jgi:hypothetical protein
MRRKLWQNQEREYLLRIIEDEVLDTNWNMIKA